MRVMAVGLYDHSSSEPIWFVGLFMMVVMDVLDGLQQHSQTPKHHPSLKENESLVQGNESLVQGNLSL